MNNHQYIVDEHIDGHGEKDDPEEFTDNEDEILAQQILNFVQIADNDIVENDVQKQPDQDVDHGIVGAEREQGCDGTRTSDERESNGDDACAAAVGLVFDDIAPQNHLHGEDEQHQRARHCERGLVDAEEPEKRVACEEEDQKESQSREAGLHRLDVLILLPDAHKDGDGTQNIDDGEHHDKRAENLD